LPRPSLCLPLCSRLALLLLLPVLFRLLQQ
jgi:hypothetical protein